MTSVAEFAVVVAVAAVLLGWTLRRFRVARIIASVLIAGSIASAVARAEAPANEEAAPATASDASDETDKATLEDGERDWGRDDGIATQLTTRSKLVVGVVFLVVLGCVIGVLAYRKPDGAAYADGETD
ncbi:MAG: hypothetical protein AAGJ46_04830 [Planctomycetota bacterium]